MPIGDANKDDFVADALEALTGYEWRKRADIYECRVNHTHAKVIRDDLADVNVTAELEVSTARSGRYNVRVAVSDGQLLLNAAEQLKKKKR